MNNYPIEGVLVTPDGRDHAALLYKLVGKYRGNPLYEDIFIHAVDGGLYALKNWKPKKGAFSSFLAMCVHGHVYQFLRKNVISVALPQPQFKIFCQRSKEGEEVFDSEVSERKVHQHCGDMHLNTPNMICKKRDDVINIRSYLLKRHPRRSVRMFSHRFFMGRMYKELSATFKVSKQRCEQIVKHLQNDLRTADQFRHFRV